MKTPFCLLKLLGLTLAACGVTTVASAQVPVRILPLGDSITEGYVVPAAVTGGYRKELHSLLTTQGYAVDYVGTLKYPNAVSEGWVDGDHEGRRGYKIDEIRNEAALWLKRVPNPDVILLHIGTNDFWAGGDLATAQDHLRNLLAELSALRPHARIIVSSLNPRTDSFEAIQDQFNDSIPGIVSEQVTLGRKVTFVDMHDGYGTAPADFSVDGVHPSSSGYDKMATIWLPAINGVITPSGTTAPPVIASVDARGNLTTVTVVFSKPIKDLDGNNAANFSLTGLTVSAASLDASKRVVTLTTSPQMAGSIQTLAVSGIHDRMVPENLIEPGTTVSFLSRTIMDGSFEANATGWTQTGNVSVPVSTTPEASDGQKLLVFSEGDTPNTGKVSQTFTTIPGREYRLQYDIGVYASNASPQQLQLTLKDGAGGPAAADLLPPQSVSLNGIGTAGNPRTKWQLRVLEFTAISASSTVAFADVSTATAGVDMLLDDVRLDAVVNEAPVAVDDGGIGLPFITVTENSGPSAPISVLENDSDADNDTLTVTAATSPNGAVTIAGGETLNFAPTTGFIGNTTISYTISDGQGGSASATAWVAVAAVGPFENGGFENGSPVDFGVPAGWEVNGGVVSYSSQGFYLTKSGNGNWMAVFNGGINDDSATLSQAFTTVVGQSYTVQFDAGLAAGVGNKTQVISAAVTGDLTPAGQTTSWPISSTAAPAQWAEPGKSFTFTANSTSTTLTFSVAVSTAVLGTRNVDLLLDNVRVTASGSGNQPPVAVADTYTTTVNTPLSVALPGVLANDSDDGPPPLVAVVDSQPNNGGSVVLNSNGSFIYTPAPGFVGTESFTYHASDGTLSSSVVTVSISVTAPVGFVNGSFENGSVIFEAPQGWSAVGVVAYADATNYIPAPGNGSWMAVFNPGANVPAVSTLSQQFATVTGREYSVTFDAGLAGGVGTKSQTLQASVSGETNPPPARSWTFGSSSPVATWGARNFTFVAGGTSTTLTFTVNISAGGAANNVDLVLDDVTVTPTGGSNQVPVAVNDGSAISPFLTVSEDSGASSPITVLANDTDADLDPLTVTSASSPNGTVVINSGTTLSFTPAANFNGTATISYTISDVLGGTASATAFVAVTPVNDAPVAVADGSVGSPFVTVAEDSGASAAIPVLGNDTDVDLNPLTVTSASSLNGTVSINSGTTLSFTPALNFHGATTISYTISDGQGGNSSAIVFLAVTPVNDAPVAVADGSVESPFVTVAEDSGASAPIAVLANDTDVELNPLTVTLASSPNGTVTINSGTTLSFTPTLNFHGATTLSYTVSDGQGGTSSATVFVSVTPVNDAPVAVNDGSAGSPFAAVAEDSGASSAIAVLANDTDLDLNPLSVTLASSPDGTVSINSGTTLSFTPALNFNGPTTISYSISDGQGGTSSATVFVAVTPVNDAPVAVADGSVGSPFVTVAEDSGASAPIAVLTNDADVDPDPLTVTSASSPDGTVLINSGTTLSFTPAENFNGTTTISYAISDGQGGTASATVFVRVTAVNDAPVAVADGSVESPFVTVAEDSGASLPVAVLANDTDVDPDVLTVTLASSPNGSVTLNSGTTLSFTPAENFNGPATISYSISDGQGGTATATVFVSVTAANDAPVAVADGSAESPFVTVTEDSGASAPITVLGNDADVDLDPLTVISATSPNGLVTVNSGTTLTFTPAVDFSGAATISYTISDGQGGTASATVFVAVTPVNDAPLAVADGSVDSPFVTINEDSGASAPVMVLANDTDVDLDALTVTLAGSPNGTVSINSGTTLSFTPAGNFNGPTTISYSISDGQGGTSSATVFVTVTPVNDLPVAGNDGSVGSPFVTVAEDSGASAPISVLGNDTDTDLDGLTLTLASSPNGAVVINSGTTLSFTPAENYHGATTVAYTISDGQGGTSSATVFVQVTPVNDAPVAVAGVATVAEDSSVSVSLAASDVDTGDVLTYEVVTGPANGSVAVVGAVATYTPDPNYHGSDSFTFIAKDSGLLSSAETLVSVTVTSVDDAPVANDQSVSLNEDGSLAITLTGSDDGAPSLTYAVVGGPSHGSLRLNGAVATYTPDPNFNGPDSFYFIALTFSGGPPVSALATVSITVNPVNDAPVAIAQTVSLNEDGTLDITLVGNDPDLSDTLVFTPGGAAHGTLTQNGAVVTYSPNPNYNGPDAFTFTVSDGTVVSPPAAVSITVTSVNDLPVAVNDGSAGSPSVTLDEDSGVSPPIPVLANDSDADLDALTITSAGSADGLVVVNPDQTLAFTPNLDFNGATTIDYTVADGKGGTAAATAFVAVTPVNDAPVAIAQVLSVNEDGSLDITLSGSDLDADITAENLTYTVTVDPSKGSLTGVGRNRVYSPNPNFNGADSFAFKVNDGALDSLAVVVQLTVDPVNDAPVAVNDGSLETPLLTIAEDSGILTPIAVLGNDSDVDLDPLTVTLAASPDGSAAVNPDGTLSFTPALDFNGTAVISYTISDGQGATAVGTVFVVVTPVNDLPVAVNDGTAEAPFLTMNEDSASAPISVLANDTDVDLDTLSVTAASSPDGVVAVGSGTILSFTPVSDFNGATTISYTISDGQGGSSSATVHVFVTAVNDAPVAIATAATVNEDGSVNIMLTGSDVDAGEVLAFAKASDPANGAVTVANGVATYVPNANFNGSDSFTFTANDGDVNSTPAAVSITVTPVDDAPVANAQSVSVNEDGSVVITLTGGDVDGDSLAFTVPIPPAHGDVSLSGAVVTYTPDPDYFGSDTFDFFVVTLPAGTPVFSAPATVSISVTPASDVPVAVDDGSVASPFLTVAEDSGSSAPIAVLANDRDADLDPLTVTAASSPNGAVVVNPDGTLVFTPTLDFNGATTISYTISDGNGGTSGATVYLSVSAVNDAPAALAQAVSLDEDGSLAITLAGSDLDGDVTAENLNYVVTTNPLHGTLGVSGRNLVYTPGSNFSGADSITFKVNDGSLDSTPAVVSITVNPVNDPPTAIAGSATVNEDGTVNITLTGSDVDAGEVLSFFKASDPSNGSVSVVNGIATYIPNSNFNGSDSFTFKANDGDVDSAPATVSITVTPVDDRPVANPQSVSVNEDGSRMITLTGSDVDGDALFFTIPGKPPHGNVTLSGAVATYTPDPNYNGPDSISFFVYTIVSGSPVFSTSAAISIAVNPVNDAPVAFAQSVSVNEDTAVNITLAGSDIEGSALVFAAGPASHGSVSLAGSVVSYTPAPNYSGPDSFTFTVSDGTAVSVPATVSITVVDVAEPGFGDWLAGFSLTADPQTDSDGDSISNAVEYVIGGNPATGSDATLLPTLDLASANLDGNPGNEDYLVFTYRRTDLSRDDPAADIQVEWSTGLSGPWAATTGMVEQVTDGDGIDSVKVFIPRALAVGGRLFTRLAVEISTPPAPE